MQDINDYALFAEVIRCGGFSAAGRALGMPKSTLSRRISALETRLGVRLIERSTRRFRVTEIGQAFYERCRTILLDVQQADAVVSDALGEPHGIVRCSCPLGLMEILSPVLAAFLTKYPKAQLQMVAVDRAVDLIDERIDVAIRVRTALTTDAALIMRTLGHSSRILVATPSLARKCRKGDLDMLAELPTLASTEQTGPVTWDFIDAEGKQGSVTHVPRMTCADFGALRCAALASLGIALLPEHICSNELNNGTLVRVFPKWHTEQGIVHIVFTTRRGLPPVVRAFIEHLAYVFPTLLMSDEDRG